MKPLRLFSGLALAMAALTAPAATNDADMSGYLFVYFTGNDISEEAVRYALSDDGLDFKYLNNNLPIVASRDISSTGGVRDPHILRRHDGKGFYMVVTDMVSANGWDSNRAMTLLKSDDLVNWSASNMNIQKRYPGNDDLLRVWAPQTIYDADAKKYMVYWSMKHGDGPDIIYYAYANKDFTDFEGEPRPLFIPADKRSCIDGDIIYKDGLYHLFYKTEGHGNGIKLATTPRLTSGEWTEYPDYKQQTTDAVEGSGIFKLIGSDKYILMYDVYMNGRYEFTESTDLKNFKVIDGDVKMNFHPRHGTVLPITADEKARLKAAFPNSLEGGTVSAGGPDGKLRVEVGCTDGTPFYSIAYDGRTIVEPSRLGLRTSSGNYADSLTLAGADIKPFDHSYTNQKIKKSQVDVVANKLVCDFRNAAGRKMSVEFVIADNDVAYRYVLPKDSETGSTRIFDELSSFDFPEGTTTFLCPQSDPMIGWKRTKPSYEEEYRLDAPMTDRSLYGHGYTFPALFRIGTDWALVSETGVDSHYCGSRLSDHSADGGYKIEFPMPGENNGNGTVEPAFALPGATPWRTVTVGSSLKPIVETTVYTDVVEPLYPASANYKPGRGTWSWIVWQDESINYNDIKTYIDFAAEMGYEYSLIDCAWDVNIGRPRMEELIRYARAKGVEPVLWYSSSGYWNDIVQSPTNCMDGPIARRNEMAWLKANGVKAIKVDFFGGDKQETMRLYEAILSDADAHGIAVVFHGCTMPRGWERMYPNYMGSEAVLASENIYFQQHFADEEAVNATTHPFIRNAAGCMEFGPVFLDKRLSRSGDRGSVRRTGDVFEVATGVLFQNPVQMFALTPGCIDSAPAFLIDFMKAVPTSWNETVFIDGYPGRYCVLARRHAGRWYVVALNAEKETKKLTVELPMLAGSEATCYTDGIDGTPACSTLKIKKNGRVDLTLVPAGASILTADSLEL